MNCGGSVLDAEESLLAQAVSTILLIVIRIQPATA